MLQNKKRIVSLILMLTLMVASLAAIGISASADETSDGTWTLVTDASTLKAGDKIVIASNAKGFVASTTISSSVMTNVAATFSTDKKTITSLPSNAAILTLGGSAGAWTLANSDGKLLGATAVKKVAWGSGTTTWSISISNNDATIQNGTSTYGRFLYNVSSPRFTTYTSATSTSMLLPQIYKLVGSTGGSDSGEEPACEHANTTTTTVDATCTENGSTTVVCNDCEETVSTETITATGHNFVDGVCENCEESEPDELTLTYTISDYAAGTQYADNEKHVLDDHTTVTTTDCYFTSELRIYSSTTYNGYAIISSDRAISGFKFNAGNNADTLNVYGSVDGSDWVLIRGVVVKPAYADYTVTVSSDLGYKYLKLDVSGTNQVRVKTFTLTTVKASGTVCKHQWDDGVVTTAATCTTKGVKTYTCSVNNCTKDEDVDPTGHVIKNSACTVCKKTTEIILRDELFTLENGKTTEVNYTLTGVITEVNTEYDSGYDNVTVTIVVDGCTDYSILCFRIVGDVASLIAVDDIITVTGKVTNYNNGTIEFVQGSTIDDVVFNESRCVKAVDASGNVSYLENTYFTFLGVGVRYKNADGTTPEKVALRFGYKFSSDVTSWGWNYKLGSKEVAEKVGEYKTAEGVTNIVFTNIVTDNYEFDIQTQLWFTVEIDGVTYTVYDNWQVDTTYDVLTRTAASSDTAAAKYAQDMLDAYNK